MNRADTEAARKEIWDESHEDYLVRTLGPEIGRLAKYLPYVEYPKCNKCGNHITPEHGGIRCVNCGKTYCCDNSCIAGKYLEKGVGYSHLIKECHECNGDPLPNFILRSGIQ